MTAIAAAVADILAAIDDAMRLGPHTPGGVLTVEGHVALCHLEDLADKFRANILADALRAGGRA